MSELGTSTSKLKPRGGILPQVFYPSTALVLILVLLSFLAPRRTEAWFNAAKSWVANEAGWFTMLSVAGFLVFVVALGFSSFGKLKLGPDHSTPDYRNSTWFSMLFATGMGIGIMYFSVAEPVMHFVKPPVGDPQTIAAARQAMRITFFHWGIHAWAIYAVVALSLAYFKYRHGLPLRVSSSLYPLIGERIHGPIGHAIDTFAVLGTIFGLATSLGLGVIQVNSGLHHLFDTPVNTSIQVVLIAVITMIATISVFSGLDRGVRRLSEFNIILAVGLLLFVLATGPTVHLLQVLVQNIGMYVSNVFGMTFNLYAYESTDWVGGWTLFYWGWWIAWSPFVGMFMARISRGRTVRELVIGALLAPLGFTFLWMTVYGNTALYMILVDGASTLVDAVSADSSVAIYSFLERLPLPGITSAIATLLVIVFFVTSADSGALVINMLASKDDGESPMWQRIFWALLVGIVAIALLVAGGLTALQAATIAAALPFTVIMLLICVAMLRAMRLDMAKREAIRNARLVPLGADWKSQLRTLVHQPRRQEVMTFLHDNVQPALEEVAAELQKQGLPARTDTGADSRVSLEVGHSQEIDFFYSVRPLPYNPPSFVLEDPNRQREGDDCYYRAEVHLREGGQGYDIMGWRKEEIIHDILDQYYRHMHFLDVVR